MAHSSEHCTLCTTVSSPQADLEHLEGKLEEFNQKRDDGGADGSATMRTGQVREGGPHS